MISLDQYSGGQKIDDIEVSISYKIVELFSAGLYSSPNKAFEELICNSYDAYADKVSVFVPPDLKAEGAYIWVCDNGFGLNANELKNLWKIGESSKRIQESGERLQIGRFGIGKLSTYILTRNLTYITKKNDQYLLVTMDYNRIKSDTEKIFLDEIELSEGEAQKLVEQYTNYNGKSMVAFDLFGKNSEPSWTLSILTDLKPKAAEIQEGRLKWILRCALPLNPKFNLFFNCAKIESSKINALIMRTWTIGKDDITAEALDFATSVYDEKTNAYWVDFQSLKQVRGTFTLYEDSLLGGKSAENGRSHGIFLSIRGRLINLDDPLLGMEAFSHGPFNRSRIIIEADGLDENLTSTRESVKDSQPLNELKTYIKRKFNNEVRKYYFEQVEQQEKKRSVSYRLSQTGYTTSKKPLCKFIEKFFADEISNPYLIEKPIGATIDELLPKYDSPDGDGDTQIIEDIEWGILGAQSPIAKLNLKQKTVTINSLHPYIANYSDSYRSTLPLESMVIAEVLTEAHLYEIGIDETDIHSIMETRDYTLRQLAFADREGMPAAAQLLHDSLANPTGLEDAVYRAFLALGFEAQKIGGNGKPDGYAQAILGYEPDGTSKNYSLTFDAKSTSGARIAAGTAKLSGLKRHQADYQATYSVEVAIGYEGEENPESAIAKESTQQKVTVMKAEDLARLLLYAIPKQLGLVKLQDLFATCYTPAEVTAWIDSWIKEPSEQGPYFEIVNMVYALQKEDKEPPTVEVVRLKINEKLKTDYPTAKIKIYAESLKNMIPGQFHYDGKYISVDCSPQVMKQHITNAINSEIPVAMRDIYNAMFGT